MKRNAAKIKIKVSDRGAICLELIDSNKLAYTTNRYKVHIINYITCFNKFAEENILKPESTAFGNGISCIAYLSYYSFTDLFSNTRGLYTMDDIDLEEYATAADKDRRTALDAPTIHMTLGNILSDEDNPIDEPFKRFSRYMDSSIWNYYAPIIVKDEMKDGLEDPNRYDFSSFISAIHAIINNSFFETQKGLTNLYELNVTKEYADINERIFMQSKLMEISGHGKNVSPFLFHSEQKVKSAIKEKEQQKNEILNYKWRILLVDDHATRGLTVGEKDEANLTKLKVIQKELCELFGTETITTDCQNEKAKIYIECASTLEEAKNKLKEKKYEIILLDYLLGEKGAGREYGYELLKGIWYKENEKKFEKARKEELEKLYKEFVFDYKKGPDNRFYFMFISAFTTAVSERLLTEGWLRSEKYWYIGEGACPINTPYLFQYRLLHIMEKRMKDMNLQQFDVQSWLDKKIFSRTSPRKEARDHFKDALNFMCEYEQLEKDYSYDKNVFDSIESVMVTNFLGEKLYPKAVFEHVVQLVYLTAFGTVRQWPEMWEEYQFLKSVVGRIEVIEKYIFKLKNNNVE